MKKTNKTFKRFAAITSASLLAACAVAPVLSHAAEGKISFKNGTVAETSNTYTAYKIFSGTATTSGFGGQAELKDIQWAKAGAEGIIAKLKADTRFGEGEANDFYACTTAASVAEVLKGYEAKSAEAIAFAEVVVANASLFDGTSSSSGIINLGTGLDTEATEDDSTDDGYYVIAQTTHVGVTTAYILGVYDASSGAEVNVKVSQPTFEKKIADINDSEETTKGDWQDSADYDIGDMVPFKLKATLPTDYANYNEYMLVFHDKLDASFTYIKDGEEGYIAPQLIVNDEVVGTVTPSTGCGEKGCNLEFEIDDVMKYTAEGGVVEIVFYAKLNDDAVIGQAGNWNEAYLEYSNNPYFTSVGGTGVDNDGDGEVDEEGEEEETTDETAVDKVVAFTYQTVINKVDEKGNALEGATFTLEKYNKTTDKWEAKEVVVTNNSIFTFTGLDDGDYRLTETNAPVGYNPLGSAIEFTITAEHTKEASEPALESLNAVTAEHTGADTVIKLGDYEANVEFEYGKIEADIENKSGATLPGTGGIGTTIFYLGGGAMAAIGGVYLISKRRMRKSEE